MENKKLTSERKKKRRKKKEKRVQKKWLSIQRKEIVEKMIELNPELAELIMKYQSLSEKELENDKKEWREWISRYIVNYYKGVNKGKRGRPAIISKGDIVRALQDGKIEEMKWFDWRDFSKDVIKECTEAKHVRVLEGDYNNVVRIRRICANLPADWLYVGFEWNWVKKVFSIADYEEVERGYLNVVGYIPYKDLKKVYKRIELDKWKEEPRYPDKLTRKMNLDRDKILDNVLVSIK